MSSVYFSPSAALPTSIRAMPEGMLQLTVSLFIFSRELLCLHRLLALPTVAYPHRPRPSWLAVQDELSRSSIYLVFSREVCGSCRRNA